jgi:hypothetical protein
MGRKAEEDVQYDMYGLPMEIEEPDDDTVEKLPPPNIEPTVEYKRPATNEFIASGDQYGKLVTEQIKDREALTNLGYKIDSREDQYQAYNGEPVQDTILALVISALMAIAFILGLIVCAFGMWKMMYKEKTIKPYTNKQGMVYLRDQQIEMGEHVPVEYSSPN